MALIKPTDSLGIVFDDTLYTAVKMNADPLTEKFAKKIDDARDLLAAKRSGRVKASENAVRLEALADRAFEEMVRNLFIFEKAVAHVFAETPKAYGDFFPLSPAKLNATPIAKRESAFGPLVKTVKAVHPKNPLAVPAKKWLGLWQVYVDALGHQMRAEDVEKLAEKAVRQQKVRCCTVMREVHGNAEATFPDDRVRSESFFRKRRKVVKKKQETPPPKTAAGG